jgi:16S rRNA (adenine1518-N6/adenine1519-N6)-dimethyltransferase
VPDAPGATDGSRAPRRKRFGQHFLTDPGILARIAEASGAAPGVAVVEIGPGRGALTESLLRTGARVTAIEIDRDLIRQLRGRFAGADRLTIAEGDVLEQDLAALGGPGYVLTGNIPYNITTPILFHAMRAPRPSRAVFLLQREVGERMAADPGSDAYGALSVNLAAVASTEVLFRVPAGAFQPPPKVDSVVVRVTPRADPLVRPEEEAPFRSLVQGAFGLRRKQMRRVVRILYDLEADAAAKLLEKAAIEEDSRPETVAPDSFVRLLRVARESGMGNRESAVGPIPDSRFPIPD